MNRGVRRLAPDAAGTCRLRDLGLTCDIDSLGMHDARRGRLRGGNALPEGAFDQPPPRPLVGRFADLSPRDRAAIRPVMPPERLKTLDGALAAC